MRKSNEIKKREIPMTNEQGAEVLALTDQMAWKYTSKAPHLTRDELREEFIFTCMKIYSKYGFEPNLMKRACHTRMVDLVRKNVNNPTLNMEFNEELDTLIHDGKSSVENPTLDTGYASGAKSVEKDAADGSVLKDLVKYLRQVFDDSNTTERKYLEILMETSGAINPSDQFDMEYFNENHSEDAIAKTLGFSSGSATSFRYLRGKIRLSCAFFLYYKGYKHDIPSTEWTNQSAYEWLGVKRSVETLKKCKEVLGLDSDFQLNPSDVIV